jgi:large subunit ribosomal protein L15
MKLHELKGSEGARRPAKRVGRGHGSGHGKTSGRGTKGQNARSEGFRLGFEGGQMPFAQRIPKLGGFKNPFKVVFAVVNLSKLAAFKEGSTVGPQAFVDAGLMAAGDRVKVLGAGKLRRRLSVEAHAFSDTARAAIEARGGSVTVLEPKVKKKRREHHKVAVEAGPVPVPPVEENGEAPAEKQPKRVKAEKATEEPAAEE